MKVTIIMPAYNEEKRIGRTLESYASYFKSFSKKEKITYEIFVVINNTKDNTEKVVKSFQKKYPLIRYINLKEGGKGYAVIEGFKIALKEKVDIVGFVDADGATPPNAFHDLVKQIPLYDASMANRYDSKSIIRPKMTPIRVLISRVFNMIVRILFLMPYRDTQCGAKVFKGEKLKKIIPYLGMTQWAFDVELLNEWRKQGFSLIEIPTVWTEIEGSKIHVMKDSTKMLLSILQLRIKKSIFERLLKPLGKIAVYLWKKMH